MCHDKSVIISFKNRAYFLWIHLKLFNENKKETVLTVDLHIVKCLLEKKEMHNHYSFSCLYFLSYFRRHAVESQYPFRIFEPLIWCQ